MFADNVIVITGASSGIGAAIAELFRAEKAVVHAIGRSVEGENAHPVDFLAPDAGDRIDAIAEKLDRVDVLIHSAGVVTLGPIGESPIEDLDWNLAVNLRAPVMLTRALLPHLLKAKGQIVFVNSGAGLTARATWGHYAASKFGLRAIADSLRDEVKPKGVRVMTAYPGRTATPMQERVRELEGQPYDPEAFIQPEDVAKTIIHGLSLPRSADLIELNIRSGVKT